MNFILRAIPAALLFAAACAAAAPFAPPPDEHPVLGEIAAAIDVVQLQATVQTLVSFGTRHTMSDTQSDSRGIGTARRGAGRSRVSPPSARTAAAA